MHTATRIGYALIGLMGAALLFSDPPPIWFTGFVLAFVGIAKFYQMGEGQ